MKKIVLSIILAVALNGESNAAFESCNDKALKDYLNSSNSLHGVSAEEFSKAQDNLYEKFLKETDDCYKKYGKLSKQLIERLENGDTITIDKRAIIYDAEGNPIKGLDYNAIKLKIPDAYKQKIEIIDMGLFVELRKKTKAKIKATIS